jgi:putative tryptophan/tyrosine transport system substrate-binding protein
MMRITILTILSFLIVGIGEASPVVVSVQSVDVPPYNETLSGFNSVCRAENKRIVLSELKEKDGDLAQKVNAMGPDLILAIGLDALRAVKDLSRLPILYTMVLNPEPVRKDAPNITGVSMNIPPEKQLDIVLKVLPGRTRIGLLYDPEQTGSFVARNQKAAAAAGIRIVARVVKTAREVPFALTQMDVIPDVLWLLPDLTVIAPETVEFLFNFSLAHKIPVISFSEKYLTLGAFMSISLDVFELGRQTGEMANMILDGRSLKQIPPAEAQKAVVTINRTVAEKLGIPIGDAARNGIRIAD